MSFFDCEIGILVVLIHLLIQHNAFIIVPISDILTQIASTNAHIVFDV